MYNSLLEQDKSNSSVNNIEERDHIYSIVLLILQANFFD